MKYISKIIAVALICLISCQTAVAQLPSPSPSAKYSNEEISQMIKTHKRNRSKDIRPTTIQNQRFISDFPKARDIDWEVAAEIYEVEFEIGRIDYKAYYDKDGNLLMYKYNITESELPAVVKNAAFDKYPDSKIDDIDKVVKGTETYYVVEMEKDERDIKAAFNPEGTLIKEIFD